MRFGISAVVLLAVTIACGRTTTAGLSSPVPTAGECPQGRIVTVTNGSGEEVDVLAYVTGVAPEVLGIVDGGQTTDFVLPVGSNGHVRWRYSQSSTTRRVRSRGLYNQVVRMNVRCRV